MGETADPHASLDSGSVSERSAAARDLARIGTFADVERLVGMAVGDKSSAVRLYTAAAAADIVHRYRGLHGDALTTAQQAQVAGWVRSMDPGRNPGLLMLLSALPGAEPLERLGRMLRDPRNGVRAGAAVALRRLALSSTAMTRDDVEPAVAAWMADSRMTPDARIELIRLAGEAGYTSVRPAIERSTATGKLHDAVVEEALGRLDVRSRLSGWDGFYRGDGLDVFEQPHAGDHTPQLTWAVMADGRSAERVGARTLTLGADGPRLDGERARLVWAPQLGGNPEERVAALQTATDTRWRCEGRALVSAIEEFLGEFTAEHAFALDALAAGLEAAEGSTAQRARGLLALRAGRLDVAAALLEGLMDAKKPRADLSYWLAQVYAGRGETAKAKAALAEFLDKAGKRAQWRAEAEALLATL